MRDEFIKVVTMRRNDNENMNLACIVMCMTATQIPGTDTSPQTQTLNIKSSTLNPKPQTPNPKPQSPNPKPQTPSSKPQIPNHRPQTSTPIPQTPNPKTPNPTPQTPNLKPQTPHPNPKPQTPNPKSRTSIPQTWLDAVGSRSHGISSPLQWSEREIFIDNILVQVHWIIEMIVVERPCAMGG